MRLHHQPRPILVEPPAAVSPSNLYKINGPVVLAGPVVVFDPAQQHIDKNYAPRSQQRHHPAVAQSNVTVAMPFASVS